MVSEGELRDEDLALRSRGISALPWAAPVGVPEGVPVGVGVEGARGSADSLASRRRASARLAEAAAAVGGRYQGGKRAWPPG